MKLSIGTPPVPLFGIVDTGSDLTWTQCKPCTQCFKHKLPYFDPKHSSTYKELSCLSQFCEVLGSADPSTCTGNDSICQYSISYGDNSFSIGHLAAETFTFESSTPRRAAPIPNMVFGCGHNDKGSKQSRRRSILDQNRGWSDLVGFSFGRSSASGSLRDELGFGSLESALVLCLGGTRVLKLIQICLRFQSHGDVLGVGCWSSLGVQQVGVVAGRRWKLEQLRCYVCSFKISRWGGSLLLEQHKCVA
ncbi:hypothetical protein ACSBR2_022057 [Camellia fascicularis]